MYNLNSIRTTKCEIIIQSNGIPFMKRACNYGKSVNLLFWCNNGIEITNAEWIDYSKKNFVVVFLLRSKSAFYAKYDILGKCDCIPDGFFSFSTQMWHENWFNRLFIFKYLAAIVIVRFIVIFKMSGEGFVMIDFKLSEDLTPLAHEICCQLQNQIFSWIWVMDSSRGASMNEENDKRA